MNGLQNLDINAFIFDDTLQIRNAKESTFLSSYCFPQHAHSEYELDYVTAGSCTMIVGNKRVVLHKNEGILIFPNVVHAYEGDRKADCGMMQLEFSIQQKSGSVDAGIPNGSGAFLRLSRSEILKSIIGNIYYYHRISAGYAGELLKYEFLQLFTLIEEQLSANGAELSDQQSVPLMQKIQQSMIEHYTEPINLEKIAAMYGVSSRAIRKHFEKHFGVSPVQYLTGLRVKAACALLRGTGDSITEIALSCGFGSSQYFSRVFRTYTDMTPWQYRKMWNNKETEAPKED